MSLFQDLLHDRMFVMGLLEAVFDLDVIVDHSAFQRPGTIKRIDGDNIAEVVRLEAMQ